MIAALLITFREGLEASLIVGILLGYLKKTGQTRYSKYAWAGVIAAILVSLLLALGIQAVGAELEGPAEPIFEGTMLLIAVALLTWMIFWMRYQARSLKSSLESEMNAAVQTGHPRALFATTFFAVVREGIETALFISAIALTTKEADTLVGALIGLVVAALVGYLIFASTLRLNLRIFFNVTSVLLLVFAAGLFAQGLHEFIEVNWLPAIQENAYNLSHILTAESVPGTILKALVGYNPAPSLLEVIGYLGYWALALLAVPWFVNRRLAVVTHRKQMLIPGVGD